MPPEAAAALQAQVAGLAAACAAGRDLETLKSLVTVNPQDASWDLHLMDSLGNIGHPAIPPLLAALFGGAPDKARRKALKRVLHRLETRGVPVPREVLPREAPLLGKERPAGLKTLVSPVLGNGDSYVVLEAPKEILGGNLLVALINDAEGFKECHLLNLKSRQLAEFWEHYRKHGLTEWFPAPGPYAVRLLEEAFRVQVRGSGQYAALREKIWKNWGRPENAPGLEQEPPALDPGEVGRLLEQSGRLAADPLFHTWMPGMDELLPWVEKFEEIAASPLVLSDQQKQARGDALVDEATKALYPPETRPLWRRRLLTMAYYLDLNSRPEDARLARAAAADLGQAQSGALAGENPFLKTLVQIALRLTWEETRKPREAQQPGGLLTLPGDAPLLRR